MPSILIPDIPKELLDRIDGVVKLSKERDLKYASRTHFVKLALLEYVAEQEKKYGKENDDQSKRIQIKKDRQ